MSGAIVAIIIVVVLAIIAFAVWQYTQKQRSQKLQDQFGSAYDQTVEEYGGDQSKAEGVLSERQQQVEQVTIHPLSTEDREGYAQRWQQVQAQFVDDPRSALQQADSLIADVMGNLGYPPDTAVRDSAIYMRYPDAAENYRKAHAITEQAADGQASTEDQREGMVLYRSLFEQLVGMPANQTTEVSS